MTVVIKSLERFINTREFFFFKNKLISFKHFFRNENELIVINIFQLKNYKKLIIFITFNFIKVDEKIIIEEMEKNMKFLRKLKKY